jgi:hypothetical protein
LSQGRLILTCVILPNAIVPQSGGFAVGAEVGKGHERLSGRGGGEEDSMGREMRGVSWVGGWRSREGARSCVDWEIACRDSCDGSILLQEQAGLLEELDKRILRT